MPTYDYECQACGHRFELFQSMTAAVKRKCPECGKLQLQRLIGPGAGFLFKGDGFYITDYRSDSYRAGKTADDKSSTPSDSKTGSETTSKPDKKEKGGGKGKADKGTAKKKD